MPVTVVYDVYRILINGRLGGRAGEGWHGEIAGIGHKGTALKHNRTIRPEYNSAAGIPHHKTQKKLIFTADRLLRTGKISLRK